MSNWSAWVCGTVSGVKLQRLPVSAFSWGRRLNAGGSGTTTVPLTPTALKLGVWSLTEPVKNTLVLDRDGVIVYAGIIWDQDYDYDTQTVTLNHSDLWSLFVKRLAADVVAPFIRVTKQTYTGMSLSTLAKRVLTIAMTGLADDNRTLPITLPADVAGSISRTFYGYHLDGVADVLAGIIGEGLDIDFRPRWVAGKLDWEMRAGSPLSSGVYEWNLTSPQHGLTGLGLRRDGSKLSTTAYAIGEGSDQDMLLNSNRTLYPPYPAVDHFESYKSESETARLSARALADLLSFNHLTSQWGASMLAGGTPALTALLLGGSAKVFSKGDPVFPDGWNANRLIGFSGDLSETVKLDFQ